MGMENEVKYPLTRRSAAESAMRALVEAGTARFEDVRQGYVNPETRVRRFEAVDGTVRHVFSFKRMLQNGVVIEIEADLGERDFHLLWKEGGDRLSKRRYSFPDGEVCWDVDFFYDDRGTYFAVAEAEMPEGMERPSRIPPDLAPYVLFEASRKDARFASRALADGAYARGLAGEVGAVA